MTPAVLTLLERGPAHGYSLMQRMSDIIERPEDRSSISVFYRTLKALEAAGAVRSAWSRSEGAARRRVYELTEQGAQLLDAWLTALEADRETITRLLVQAGRRRTD